MTEADARDTASPVATFIFADLAGFNCAARVAQLAGGGEVLVTEATVEAAGSMDDVELLDRGSMQLKNVAEPVGVYRATARRST